MRFNQDSLIILPVFAGMIPWGEATNIKQNHSPRIRGDDPDAVTTTQLIEQFSPYSRG